MTPRSIRRAQERKARKEEQRKRNKEEVRKARNADALHAENRLAEVDPLDAPFESAPEAPEQEDLFVAPDHAEQPDSPSPISPARLAANRANAQLSTGPRTEKGKSKSSLNAVTSALTGRTVLLPTDDAVAYEQHLNSYEQIYRPIGQLELDLVQGIADTVWRLKRIPGLEMAIFAQAQLEFGPGFEEYEASLRAGLVEFQALVKYEKQLRNLHLQENRLARRYRNDTAELRQCQQERSQREKQQLEVASRLFLTAWHDKKPFDPADHGFECSIEDIHSFLRGRRALKVSQALIDNPNQALPGSEKRHSQAA